MDGWTFKTSADLRHILESFPNLRELHLNLCLGLVNETKAIVSAVVALHELQHIYLERTSFLTPHRKHLKYLDKYKYEQIVQNQIRLLLKGILSGSALIPFCLKLFEYIMYFYTRLVCSNFRNGYSTCLGCPTLEF